MDNGIYGCDNTDDNNYPKDYPNQCTKPAPQPIASIVYFGTFVVVSAFMLLNLFIGVITTSMQEAKRDLSKEFEAEKLIVGETDADIIIARR